VAEVELGSPSCVAIAALDASTNLGEKLGQPALGATDFKQLQRNPGEGGSLGGESLDAVELPVKGFPQRVARGCQAGELTDVKLGAEPPHRAPVVLSSIEIAGHV